MPFSTAVPRASVRLAVLCAAIVGSGCQAAGPTNADPEGPGAHDRDPLVASVSVTPSTATLTMLPAGETLQLQAVPLDAQKRPLSGRTVVWASDDPQRVSVDPSGRVTAVRGTGPVRVTATVQGVWGAALVSAVVYRNDFTGQAPGPLTRAALDATWNTPRAVAGVAEGRAEIVRGAEAFQGSGEAMRIGFPKGSVGLGAGGAGWVLPLGGSYRELYASYRVRFGPGFRFAQGGKLPGLAGGTGNTGGLRPTGLDGWSGRVMWGPNGRMLQYVYHPDQAGDYGEGMHWITGGRRVVMAPDRWYHVETRVVMNSPGQRDGTVQSWVDGTLVLDRGGLRFRDTAAWGIDAFHMATFFGGNDPSWAAQRDEVVYFDDFVIATERTWPGGEAPITPEPELSSGS